MCEMYWNVSVAEQESWKETSGSWMSHLKEYGKKELYAKKEPDFKNKRVWRTLKKEWRQEDMRKSRGNYWRANLQDIEEA